MKTMTTNWHLTCILLGKVYLDRHGAKVTGGQRRLLPQLRREDSGETTPLNTSSWTCRTVKNEFVCLPKFVELCYGALTN